MTKRDIRAKLETARDEAWRRVLTYERSYAVEPWPEQRSGSLRTQDVYAARLRGIVAGLDAAVAALKVGR